jgi:epoxyqueuosine reductase
MDGAVSGVHFPIPASANEHRYLVRNRGDKSSVKDAATNPQAKSELRYRDVRALAIDAGFAEAGLVALPYEAEERDAGRFREWVNRGCAGTMRYLEQKTEDGQLKRERVRVPFPWARSAIVCFASYFGTPVRSTDAAPEGAGWIARYAWSSQTGAGGVRRPSDYHKVLLKRLKELEAQLRAEFGEFESRAYVDTGPVVERALAVAAGIGWSGKNTCLINPRLGSWGFLAVLLTSLEITRSAGQQVCEPVATIDLATAESGHDLKGHNFSRAGSRADNLAALAPEKPSFEIPDRCGTCTRCIGACPTNALDVPYQMDAKRCIAYLTIEHRGPIDEKLMPGIGRQVFGCDICQDVCPWNRKAPIVTDAEMEPRAELIHPDLEWLASLDEHAFEREFNGSPVRRAGFNGLRRNIAIAMGNSGLARFAPKLEEWADVADEGLRSAAQWALARLRSD